MSRRKAEAPRVFPSPLVPSIETALRREGRRGGHLSLTKWQRMFMITGDASKELWTQFHCNRCGFVRRMAARAAEDIMRRQEQSVVICSMVGMSCYGAEMPELCMWAGEERETPPARQGLETDRKAREFRSLKSEPEDKKRRPELTPRLVKEPFERKAEDGKELTSGLSRAALQFFQTSGRAIPLPKYTGTTSKAVFLSWRRAVESHFETHGVSIEREKVLIAARMLKGEAEKWWNGIWLSGRQATIPIWEEMLRKLRLRFLLLEGEMHTVGQWRRLQQTDTLAAYADYVYRLQALCPMPQGADFKLVFFMGYRRSLQGEVHKYMRQRELTTLSLETRFQIAGDAEWGMKRHDRGDKDSRARKDAGRHHPTDKFGNWEQGNRVSQMTTGEQDSYGGGKQWGDNSNHAWGTKGGRQQWQGGEWIEGERQRRDEAPYNCSREWRGVCWVCDAVGHSWMNCQKKKEGKGCARCGSTAHRLVACPRRTKEGYSVSADVRGIADTGGWNDNKGSGGQGNWGSKPKGDSRSKGSGSKASVGDSEEDLLVFEMGMHLPWAIEGVLKAQTLQYEVTVNRLAMTAMLDSGVSVNAISAAGLDRLGGMLTPTSEQVRFADQWVAQVEGTTRLEIRSKGHVSMLECLVIRQLGSELILGRPWLQEWNPTVDWLTGRLVFSDGVVWRPIKTPLELDAKAVGVHATGTRLSEKAK